MSSPYHKRKLSNDDAEQQGSEKKAKINEWESGKSTGSGQGAGSGSAPSAAPPVVEFRCDGPGYGFEFKVIQAKKDSKTGTVSFEFAKDTALQFNTEYRVHVRCDGMVYQEHKVQLSPFESPVPEGAPHHKGLMSAWLYAGSSIGSSLPHLASQAAAAAIPGGTTHQPSLSYMLQYDFGSLTLHFEETNGLCKLLRGSEAGPTADLVLTESKTGEVSSALVPVSISKDLRTLKVADFGLCLARCVSYSGHLHVTGVPGVADKYIEINNLRLNKIYESHVLEIKTDRTVNVALVFAADPFNSDESFKIAGCYVELLFPSEAKLAEERRLSSMAASVVRDLMAVAGKSMICRMPGCELSHAEYSRPGSLVEHMLECHLDQLDKFNDS